VISGATISAPVPGGARAAVALKAVMASMIDSRDHDTVRTGQPELDKLRHT
jgi:hypothetical protein